MQTNPLLSVAHCVAQFYRTSCERLVRFPRRGGRKRGTYDGVVDVCAANPCGDEVFVDPTVNLVDDSVGPRVQTILVVGSGEFCDDVGIPYYVSCGRESQRPVIVSQKKSLTHHHEASFYAHSI